MTKKAAKKATKKELPDSQKKDTDASQVPGKGILGTLLSAEDPGKADPPEPEKKKRGRPRKKKAPKLNPDEIARLLLVPVLAYASGKYIPEPVQPNDDEILNFCIPASNIIVRHIPDIPASEDMVDLGRMALVGMAYYVRIQPIVEAMKEAEAQAETEIPEDVPRAEIDESASIEERSAPARTGL